MKNGKFSREKPGLYTNKKDQVELVTEHFTYMQQALYNKQPSTTAGGSVLIVEVGLLSRRCGMRLLSQNRNEILQYIPLL